MTPGTYKQTPGSSEQTQIMRRDRKTEPPVTVVRVLSGSGPFQFWIARPGTTGVIGRGPEADLMIQDPSVSRSHVRIEVGERCELAFVDLGSTNGTFVNDDPILPRRVVRPGDRVLVGAISVSVEVLTVAAVDELRRAASRLDAAGRDPLTALVSRRWIDDQLPAFIARHHHIGEPVTCVFVDLDGFKRINDQHGHGMGDVVLKTTADILLRTIRENDVAVRYGGDELVVFLSNCRATDGVMVADRLRAAIEATVWAGISGGQVTLSAGVAELRVGEGPSSWLERADGALYRAKRAGRKRTISD